MKRMKGRPIGGFAEPGELTAVFVAGRGYNPLIRHELTHAISFVYWGELRGGTWLAEGIATLAQGTCQGKSVDALAAGYLMNGKLPSVASMMNDFRSIPELPGYIGAASFIQYVRSAYGIESIRSLWKGEAADSLARDVQNVSGGKLEREWHAALRSLTPAAFDSARLYREGC
jgi:hypothetical protein